MEQPVSALREGEIADGTLAGLVPLFAGPLCSFSAT